MPSESPRSISLRAGAKTTNEVGISSEQTKLAAASTSAIGRRKPAGSHDGSFQSGPMVVAGVTSKRPDDVEQLTPVTRMPAPLRSQQLSPARPFPPVHA
eukprot:6059886-Pyramimonas_sp.AAC.1